MAGGDKKPARKPSYNPAALDEMRQAEAQAAPDMLGDMEAPDVEHNGPRLPQPCPVTPLGMLGDKLVFLDGLRQVQMVPPDGARKNTMVAWFGADYLHAHYATDGKERWDTRQSSEDLIMDCRAKGIFNPQGKVLGRGAHRPLLSSQSLVLHIGREVLVAPEGGKLERAPAGMVKLGGKEVFFPAADTLPRPADKGAERAEGEALLDLFTRWNWVEPKAAPLLLLGWVAQAMICGALEWRAHIWLPGPTASGKSSLQKIIRSVIDEHWCLATADATEAAIRQMLNNDTLPVCIDEAEPHDNPERQAAVMNLMKKASSGDKLLRGSSDHKGQEFTARSCFLLSSVMHATMRGEDRNRVALLEMRELPEDVPPLEMELARWNNAGRRLQRRMIEQWPRFERTLALYRREIGTQRFAGRWQDTFGTLLACADLMLFDHAPDYEGLDGFDESVQEPGMGRVRNAVTAILPLLWKGKVEARTDTERAVLHLLSKPLPGAPGKAAEPVGVWLDRAMKPSAEDGMGTLPNEEARDKLKAHGMRVVQLRPDPDNPDKVRLSDALLNEEGWQCGYLALAYPTNAALQELWRGTDWAGDGYKQSLAKAVHGHQTAIMNKKVRFAGSQPDNALLVPLEVFRGDED